MLTEIGPDKRGLRFVRDLAGDRGERFLQLSRVQFGLMKTGEGGSKAIFWMKDGDIRPISAYFSGASSLRAAERILVSRLARRSRQRRATPSGKLRRYISVTC